MKVTEWFVSRMRGGLVPSSVTRALPLLLEHDYLRESEAAPHGRGRPQKLLHVNPDKHIMVGIKIGPAQVSAMVTDMAANVLARAETPIADCTPETALSAAASLTRTCWPRPRTRRTASSESVSASPATSTRPRAPAATAPCSTGPRSMWPGP